MIRYIVYPIFYTNYLQIMWARIAYISSYPCMWFSFNNWRFEPISYFSNFLAPRPFPTNIKSASVLLLRWSVTIIST